ncbi:hypothetical protein [Nonomuraea sp. NEAU-A123]|uniref:hypothetical protein n=1 Tax=Nonomuraea sp. NEAU-A123 TaxID=2839649 RepID=UPI001BE45C7A|nr:hypothetical protein [Nonomuraea sp. NEAU-A123]MBT2231560.1 hypothetical protein [Nonomuraea sp. NEAU-A123]
MGRISPSSFAADPWLSNRAANSQAVRLDVDWFSRDPETHRADLAATSKIQALRQPSRHPASLTSGDHTRTTISVGSAVSGLPRNPCGCRRPPRPSEPSSRLIAPSGAST